MTIQTSTIDERLSWGPIFGCASSRSCGAIFFAELLGHPLFQKGLQLDAANAAGLLLIHQCAEVRDLVMQREALHARTNDMDRSHASLARRSSTVFASFTSVSRSLSIFLIPDKADVWSRPPCRLPMSGSEREREFLAKVIADLARIAELPPPALGIDVRYCDPEMLSDDMLDFVDGRYLPAALVLQVADETSFRLDLRRE
jgi:hypothetical protein